jgi:mono/diheme cytochrome c family protein
MFLVYIAGRLHQRRSHTDIFIEELSPMRLSPYRVAVTSACLLLAAAFAGCGQPASAPPAPAATPAAAPAESQVDRGHRLVIGGGCHDCHTPKKIGPNGPEADMTRMLSGHPESDKVTAPYKQKAGEKWTIHINDHLTAWSGAWGVSFAANLTPDMNTGLGIWTEDMFVQALKQGKHMGKSRPILPPMPWNWYGQLPDDDLKAMFAYLKSLPAVSNRVPIPLGPDGKPIEAP